MYKIHKYWIDNYKVIKDSIWLNVNKNARLLLKENLNKYNFQDGRLLNENKLEWINLSYNATALYVLNENQYKFDWEVFNINSKIFTYDYELMKNKMKTSGIAEELMAFIFHPKNMNKWYDWDLQNIKKCLNLLIFDNIKPIKLLNINKYYVYN